MFKLIQIFGKPHNLQVCGSKPKGPQQDSQNRLRSRLHGRD